MTRLDFDIEGAWVADRAAVDRRSQALSALERDEAAGKPLQVWLTLPVLPTGLTADGLYVVQSALKYGVGLGGVNVMAMDYGDSAAPDPGKTLMGQYAIQSAGSLHDQLASACAAAGIARTDAQLWQEVGVTPMIGVNDVQTEVFDQSAAHQLLAFAQQKGLGELAFWSAARDQAPPAGRAGHASPTDSGVPQQPGEFTKIFEAYQGVAAPTPTPTPAPTPTSAPTPTPTPTPPPAANPVSYQVTSNWGSGFIGQVGLANTTASPWAGWTLEFDLSASITSIWNAVILSHTGNHYVIGNVDWDGAVTPGGAVGFGFQASGTASASPANYVLNGRAVAPG